MKPMCHSLRGWGRRTLIGLSFVAWLVAACGSEATSSNEGALTPNEPAGNGDNGGAFDAPSLVPVAGMPVGVAAADLNGDGRPDLATVDRDPEAISILINLGGNTWSAPTAYPTGRLPGRPVVADLDRDGALDVATANAGSDDVTILWGAGDGTFSPDTVTLGWLITPSALAVADLDEDSRPDLITVNEGHESVVVVRGLGGRNWADPRFFPVGTYGRKLRTLPEQRLDSEETVQIDVLRRTLATGDFNEDGLQDVVVGDWDEGRVTILLVGDVDILDRVHLVAGYQVAQVSVGDFNSDGDLDVAAVSRAEQAVQVFDGDGRGGFAAARSFATGAGPIGLAIGEVDADGIADLVVVEGDANSVEVMHGVGSDGAGDGTFAGSSNLSSQGDPSDVALFDADGDGFADLAVCNKTSRNVTIYRNTRQRRSNGCSPSTCDDGNSCTADYCASDGSCRHRPLAQSSPCDDGLFCTTEDRCSLDTCIGIQRDCSHLGNLCQFGVCDEENRRCATELLSDGSDECVDPCEAPELRCAFGRGREQGRKEIRSLWRPINDCDQIETFEVEMLDAVSTMEPPASSDRQVKQCRFAGRMDGVYAELEHLQAVCSAVCYMDGDLVGSLAAKLYCELAIEAEGELETGQWFRQPVNVCGLTYQVACDSRYAGATASYSNDKGACLPYTKEPFWDAWDYTRQRTCDYHNDEAP